MSSIRDNELIQAARAEILQSVYRRERSTFSCYLVTCEPGSAYDLHPFSSSKSALYAFTHWDDLWREGFSRALAVVGAYGTPQAGVILAQQKDLTENTSRFHAFEVTIWRSWHTDEYWLRHANGGLAFSTKSYGYQGLVDPLLINETNALKLGWLEAEPTFNRIVAMNDLTQFRLKSES